MVDRNKKNKIYNILLVNFILFVIFFIFAEIMCFFYSIYDYVRHCKQFSFDIDKNDLTYNYKMLSYNDIYEKFVKNSYRKTCINEESEKSPIVLFGCSFVYGAGLKDEETFSYKLSKYTKRPVYNRGLCSTSIQHAIFQLENDSEFFNSIEEPKYIIYTFKTGLHIDRLYKEVCFIWDKYLNLRYVERNGDLVIDLKNNWIQGSYIYKCIKKLQIKSLENGYFTENERNFVIKHFEKLRKEIMKYYKNTKIVILFYSQGNEFEDFNIDLKKRLEEKGFIVLDTKDLTGIYLDSEYQISEQDGHPNAKTWDVVVPQLVKVLNL